MRNTVGQTPRGDDFYQRTGLLNTLYRRLNNNAHVYMAAPRRMGKTALMRYLEDNKHDGFDAVYVITESIDNSEDFFKKILEELFKSSAVGGLKKYSKVFDKFINAGRFKKLEAFGFSVELNDAHSSYYQELHLLLRDLQDAGSELKLIIMIDEFPQTVENILKKHGEAEAIKFLQINREMRQQAGDAILFLITGSIGLPALAEKLDAAKTVNDLNVFEISPLTAVEAKDLLSKLLSWANVPYQDSALDLVLSKLEWFSPYYIQLLAQEFIDQYDLQGAMINEAAIDKAFRAITDRRNDMNFAHYYSRLQSSFAADELAFALAVLKKLCQQASLNLTDMQTLAQNLANFEFVLRALEFDGYVFKTQQQEWRFTSPILKLWWTQYVNA